MKYKEVIPKCFWHDSEPSPIADTVGDLIEQLQRLPHDLEVRAGFSCAAMLVVYNIDRDNMYLEICEVDWDDEDDSD